MGWFLDGFRNKQANLADNAGRGNNQSANVAQESSNRSLDAYATGHFYVGQVIRAGAGCYDVSVRGQQMVQVACILAGNTQSYYLGTNDCYLPVEGSKVMVYVPFKGCPYGVIVGTLPGADHGSPLPESKIPLQMLLHQIDLEPGASYATETAYRKPFEDPDYVNMVNSHNGRPLDLFPGNRMWVTEQGMSIALLNLMLQFKATDRAKIELGILDDTFRMVSGYFRHIHSQGEDQIYNDGGFITRVTTGSQYQCEHAGFNEYGTQMTTDTGEKILIKDSVKTRLKLLKPDLASKKRFQMLAGHMGDVLNYFVAKPDPAQNPETYSADSKDQGLLQTHIDGSGRVIMRSAGGISFQRWDRIPIPKLQKEPWDPKGDKVEDDAEVFEEKKPFIIPDAYRYARSLVMRDMMAWYHKLAYQRIHELSKSNGGKDYYLPEEKDLKTPDDKYDEIGKAEEKFSEYDLRQAYFNVEPDGSIILRDAWGSEIIMRGGNIIITCAGQIEQRSGRSLVQLAGHDVITKARKSIDITATDRDVRIKANVNLHMLSEGREGPDAPGGGGILLESKAKKDSINFTGVKGEQVKSAGIILKSKDATICIDGKTVHTASAKKIIFETFDEEGANEGTMYISVGKLLSNAVKQTIISTNKNAGLILTNNTAALAGRSANLIGGRSVTVTKGAKAWVPLMIVDIPSDPYATVQARISDLNDVLQAQDWLKPFAPVDRKDIQFTYRSTNEYGTNRPTEVQGATKFLVYQASWAYLAKVGAKLLNGVKIEGWIDYEIDETYAWPGKDAYTAQSYLKLDQEVNIEDPAQGIPKQRKSLQSSPGGLSEVPFNEYEVVI